MTWIRSPAGRAILGVAAIYVLMVGLMLGLRASGIHLGQGVRLGLVVAFAIPVGWLVLRYWRGIDEAAREAQKWASFWGGASGMAVALVAIKWQPQLVIETFAIGAQPAELIAGGALVLVGGQIIGFTVAWAAWWAIRR